MHVQLISQLAARHLHPSSRGIYSRTVALILNNLHESLYSLAQFLCHSLVRAHAAAEQCLHQGDVGGPHTQRKALAGVEAVVGPGVPVEPALCAGRDGKVAQVERLLSQASGRTSCWYPCLLQ